MSFLGGERNGRAKLSDREVIEIRDLHTTGEWTHQQLADEFGVCRQHVSSILSGRFWKEAV